MLTLKGIVRAAKTSLFCVLLALTPLALAVENPAGVTTNLEKIDLNAADAATIAQVMDGVGMVKAQEIVAYREQHGKFRSLEQLMDVKGIGTATIEKNRDRVMVIAD